MQPTLDAGDLMVTAPVPDDIVEMGTLVLFQEEGRAKPVVHRSYTAGGVSFGYRSALLTADNPLTEARRASPSRRRVARRSTAAR